MGKSLYLLAACTGLALSTPASATTTFAQFLQALPSAKIFTYTNVSSGPNKATITTSASAATVLVANLGSLPSPLLANVSLTAAATALPTLSGSEIDQLFSGTLVLTLLSPQMGLWGPSTHALTVTFANAELKAVSGGAAPTLAASSGAGSVISYSSDFEDLTDTSAEDFSLSFSGSSSILNLLGGRLPNFRISGSGTFAADPSVPEPSTWAICVVGFGLLGGTLRLRRSTALLSA